MTARQHLPNRRGCFSFDFQSAGCHYTATIARFANGDVAEIFLSNGKAGSDADTAARDSAVVASIALQHSVPMENIRRALLRDSQGRAGSPLGIALDLLAGEASK